MNLQNREENNRDNKEEQRPRETTNEKMILENREENNQDEENQKLRQRPPSAATRKLSFSPSLFIASNTEDIITLDALKMAAEIVEKGGNIDQSFVRVPPGLFQANPGAYTPLFVSVGPFHYIGHNSNAAEGSRRVRFKNVNILAMETKKRASMLDFMSSKRLGYPFAHYILTKWFGITSKLPIRMKSDIQVPSQLLYDVIYEDDLAYTHLRGVAQDPNYTAEYTPNNHEDIGGHSGAPQTVDLVLDDPGEKLLVSCRGFVNKNLGQIWELYYKEIQISQETLASIMLIDGCFLLDFLARGSQHMMFLAFRRDLVLLENQIPFSVLAGLSDILGKFDDRRHLGMLILQTFKLCPTWVLLHDTCPDDTRLHNMQLPRVDCLSRMNFGSDCIHLLDFIYKYHVTAGNIPRSFVSFETHDWQTSHGYYLQQEHSTKMYRWILLPLMKNTKAHSWRALDPRNGTETHNRSRSLRLRNATKLRASGVSLAFCGVSSILALQFSNGVFCIPPLVISDYTETLFINLLAHEHLSPSCQGYFTSYVFLMGQLIESMDDFKLLEEAGIIHNELGSKDDLSKLFSNISKSFVLKDFCYADLCHEIETYADSTWLRHVLTLKERYLSSPWTTISVVAATILLVLTLLQTIYTMLSYYKPMFPKK